MGLLKSRRTPLTIVRRLKRSVKRTIRNKLRTLDTTLASQDSIETPEDPEASQNTKTSTPQPPHPLPHHRKPLLSPSHPLHPLNQERLLSQYSPNLPTTPLTYPRPDTLISSRAEATGTPLPCDHSKMIFYDIPVSASTWSTEDYERRFKYVKGELMRAVVDHDELRLCGRHINYSLHMIGSSAETAVPSILIECRKCDLKSLRDLFNPRVTDQLCCRKESTWHKLFNSDTIPPKPPFQLIYLATNQHPMRRYAAEDTMTVLRQPIQTLCGVLVEHQGRMATVSLTLMVDGISRLVTVDHLFSDDIEDETSLCTIGDNSSQTVENAEGFSDDQGSASQIETEEAQVDEDNDCAATTLDDSHNALLLPAPNTTSAPHSEHRRLEEAIKGEMIEPLVPLQDSAPYLDWALVHTDTQPSDLQNRNFIFPDATSDPILLEKIADGPRFHGVRVYMVSGREGLRNGRLLGGLGYLGARPGHEPCPHWTLLLDSPKDLTPGECGSIVVDQETFEVYGHVVGSNIMQHIYVVPLKEIVKQVRLSFNATTVCLPQLGSPSITSESVNLNHQRGQKAYGPVRVASPQSRDPWYVNSSIEKMIGVHENMPYITLVRALWGDDFFEEVEGFMNAQSSNLRSKRRAIYVEAFCKGGQFALDSSIPQSANCTTLPDLPYKARVSDWDPRSTSDSITSLVICSNLELYQVLSKKRFCYNAEGYVEGPSRRRIYISNPNGTSVLALIRTAPAGLADALRSLFDRYITTIPRPSINIEVEDWRGGSTYQLSFQFPFWALFPRDYEDPRPPDNNGRLFRRRTDLSALIPGRLLVDSYLYDQHYLHEAVISLTIAGHNEEYWTVVCFEDGPPDSLEQEVEDKLPGEMETALHRTSPRSYFLHAMATSLEKTSDYQQDVLSLFQGIFDEKMVTAICSSLRREPSSAVSFHRDMAKILEEVIDSISGINTKVQRFLSEDAVIGPEGIPRGPYMRSLRDDEHAMKLFRRITRCRSSLEDIESQFRRLVKKIEELEGVQIDVSEPPYLLERLLQHWKAVSFVVMAISHFATVAVLAWVASRLGS